MQEASSSFNKLLNGNHLIGNSSVRISVALSANLMVRVETQNHTVYLTSELISGMGLQQNQRDNKKLNCENLINHHHAQNSKKIKFTYI